MVDELEVLLSVDEGTDFVVLVDPLPEPDLEIVLVELAKVEPIVTTQLACEKFEG